MKATNVTDTSPSCRGRDNEKRRERYVTDIMECPALSGYPHFCTMRLDEIATEAAAHRAAVAALLQRHLPYGRLEHVAREVGKSREYLARILSDKPYGYGMGRLEPLRPALAAQLAAALGFDANERYQLLEHAELSHTSQTKTHNVMQEALAHHELDALLPALLTLHASANRASNPAVASHLYTSAYAMAKHLMERLPRHDSDFSDT